MEVERVRFRTDDFGKEMRVIVQLGLLLFPIEVVEPFVSHADEPVTLDSVFSGVSTSIFVAWIRNWTELDQCSHTFNGIIFDINLEGNNDISVG